MKVVAWPRLKITEPFLSIFYKSASNLLNPFRMVRPPNECPVYDNKQSDVDSPEILRAQSAGAWEYTDYISAEG